MGEHTINRETDEQTRLQFLQNLLTDIEALERMLSEGKIESGITRIGAEQEFCLVDELWRPGTNATSVLDSIADPHFTTELARYNLEINLDPFELKNDVFSVVQHQLETLISKARTAASKHGSKVVLSGILPTISTYELGIDFMTPIPRYYALNEMLKKLRGADFRLNISGVNELSIKHSSVMFEACNTSFQMHLQVDPDDFASSYNWAQAISGPVLGMCVNSPLLLGRELWSETRIALFQQSIDTRGVSKALKNQPPRVAFGESWGDGSIADIFKNEIARHKIILSREIEGNSMEDLEQGRIPKLQAANLHNSTIYRWNRPCYGVGNGKAHVRIENRYIPAGPTTIDEMANFAFWVGLMVGRPIEYNHLADKMDFRDAKSNFIKAARHGSETIMKWMGKEISLTKLILDELLPLARKGLKKMKIDQVDIDRLLGIIEGRALGKTGSQWIVESYRSLRKDLKQDKALVVLTKTIFDNQQTGKPVHQWPVLSTPNDLGVSPRIIGNIMTTHLVTAYAKDSAEFILRIMEWKNIHHLPVVDHDETLVGLLTWTHLQRFNRNKTANNYSLSVSEIMATDIHTAKTSTDIQEAIALMKKHEIGCLPVIQKNQLVGIVTIADLRIFDHG